MDTNKLKNLLAEVKNGTKTEEDATKEIMIDYGKSMTAEQNKATKIQTDLDNANAKITTYETEIKSLKESSKDNDDWKSKFEQLDAKIKKDEADAKAKAEDEALTETIINAFGDKKFTSDYVKNGIIADVKTEMSKAENKGLGVKEIFESLTKDKEGIFENPNKPVDMPPAGNVKTEEITKEAFTKMGYLQRVNLKQENPELYKSLVE